MSGTTLIVRQCRSCRRTDRGMVWTTVAAAADAGGRCDRCGAGGFRFAELYEGGMLVWIRDDEDRQPIGSPRE